MAKKWSELMARIPAERRAGIERRTEELVREMPLAELRNARQADAGTFGETAEEGPIRDFQN